MKNETNRWVGLEWDAKGRQDLAQGGFVDLSRRRLRNLYEQGQPGPWYQLETVHPHFVDAVVLVLYHSPRRQGQPRVLLRRCLRPSVVTRMENRLQSLLDQGKAWPSRLWELPAGGIEPMDLEPGGLGVKGRAQMEAWEETGIRVRRGDLRPLGRPVFAAPAFCTERLHFFACAADPRLAQEPEGDGHPLEEGAELRWLPLARALAWCGRGEIVDSKTELGLRRFAAWWPTTSAGTR
ncbi:MAG: NUDIX hydrolase [Desulfarculus sp.]|nr:NUDIX hydrolase [Desulfarculus sp.]